MKGKSVFISIEKEQIESLISRKLKTDKSAQQSLRNKIRAIGFYHSDFYTRSRKYDVQSFTDLITEGKITII